MTSGMVRRPGLALVGVGVGYFLITVFFVGAHLGLSHDETVYLSQVDPAVPNFTWNAWRAWGMPVVFAPVAVFSPGLAAVRLYASVLTAIALVLAFWPWLKILRGYVAPLAALLFSSCWIAIYYGNDVQPNLYVGFGAVCAVGLFVRAVAERDKVWLVVALAFACFLVALMRPSDGLLVAAPLGLACLVARPLRRPVLLIPLGIGVLLGWVPWVVEAYTRFGGPVNRYRISSAHDAVGGLHLNVHTADIYLRILNGPLYGFRGSTFHLVGGRPTVWLAATVVAFALVALGLYVAVRRNVFPAVAMPVAGAALLTLFYVFLLGYGAVRFLLPILALLTIPIALALVWLARPTQRRIALLGAVAVCAGVAGDLTLQFLTANKLLGPDRSSRATFQPIGLGLRQVGVGKPCVVLGTLDVTPIGYWARCEVGALPPGPTALGAPLVRKVRRAVAQGKRVAVVTRASGLPAYFDGWQKVSLPGVSDTRIHAWLSPAPARG